MGGREGFGQAIEGLEPQWNASVGRLFEGFGLKPHAVARLHWAATELSQWSERCVVVIELEKDQDASVFQVTGQPVELKLAGKQCRRLAKPSWPHPYAVLDQRTIVTGAAELLSELADRAELRLASSSLAQLLEAANADADAALLVDLAAARQAGWRLPASLMDVWPSGREPWHALWDVPQAIALTVQTADRNLWEIGLTCDGEAAAQRVHAAVEALVPAAKAGFEAQGQWINANRDSGRFSAETAAQFEQLLQQASGEIDRSRREIAGATVWVRFDASERAADFASAAWASREAIRAVWLDAAREADTANHRRLLESLDARSKTEGSFPMGAGNEKNSLLPPETRLSWIATMLPYLGHRDWYEGLELDYQWNGSKNQAIASRPLAEVVNPTLGPSNTEAGFPVTHYVGVAGVGPDAGKLKRDDPKAGVFGFSQRTRPQDLKDGAANTIATMGVQSRLGPWAAGGDSTVRALTQRPYVNGPDGFGSGQPDGMLVGMADGSVRFISKDVDPAVLEQLATVGGGEAVSVATLDPQPQVPARSAPAESAGPETADPQPEASAVPAPAAEPIVLDEARLDDPLVKIELADMPLVNAVDLLSRMSTVPISFDLDAMAALGVGLRDPVTVRAADATVRGVVEAIVASRGLAIVVDKGQVLVTAPEAYRTELRSERYAVADLVGSDPAAATALAEQIRRLVAPEVWVQPGGRGSLEMTGNVLAVSQTQATLDQVAMFCERLRMARGLPPKNPQLAKRLTLQTRWAQARERLGRPVSANHQTTALAAIVADLGQFCETTIVVDWRALGEEGIPPQVEATLKVHRKTLEEALTQLLQPLGLACRVVDATTLEVTSRKAITSRLGLEFYPVGDHLGPETAVEPWIEQIKAAVGKDRWREAGGPGAIGFDGPSKSLIVLQSQPIQVGVEAVLSRQQASKK
jgi:hypothetical protein